MVLKEYIIAKFTLKFDFFGMFGSVVFLKKLLNSLLFIFICIGLYHSIQYTYIHTGKNVLISLLLTKLRLRALASEL